MITSAKDFITRPMRRATAPPAPSSPSEPVGSPSISPTRSPVRARSSTLPPASPPVKRHSLKRFRKFYIRSLSKTNSYQDQTISSATYYRSNDMELIRLETLRTPRGIDMTDTLLLGSPLPNKGPGMPRLIRNISQSNTMKSIGFMIPIAPNLGYFSRTTREDADRHMHNQGWKPSDNVEVITYETPLPFDNLVVLASRISARRSRRSLNSPPKTWFIQAMWEGLKRIRDMRDNTTTADQRVPHEGEGGIPKMVDGVMNTFGDSLLHFHYKVMKIQQKSPHGITTVEERKNIVQQEISQRNEEITRTQASWHMAEQEREKLRRRESDLRRQLRLNDPVAC